METKIPLKQITPTPPPAYEVSSSVDSLSNRLDTLENLNISNRLNTLETNKADISNVRNRIKNLFLTSRDDLVNSPNLSYTSGDIDCNNNNRLLNIFNGWDDTNRKNFPAKATNTWALIAQIGSYMYGYLEGSDTFSNAGTLVQTMIDEKGRVYARRKEGGTWYDWYQQGAQEDSSSIGQDGWIRFANGLQICWDNKSVSTTTTIHPSGNSSLTLKYNRASFTFPKAFTSNPSVFCEWRNSGKEAPWGSSVIEDLSTTAVGIMVWNLNESTSTSTLYYMAIGTWK